MDRVKRGRVTVIYLDGSEIEGDYRMPPPLADRFAFERHYGGSYSRIYSYYIPAVDEKTGEPVVIDGEPQMRIDPANPIPSEWDAFLVYQQLHRQGLVELKFEQWERQLDEISIAFAEAAQPDAGAEGEQAAEPEEAADLDPPVLTAPLG